LRDRINGSGRHGDHRGDGAQATGDRTPVRTGCRDQAATARTAKQLGLKPGLAWHQLVGHAVLRCPGEARHFLDAANWQSLRQRRRRMALTAMFAGALVVLAVIRLTARAA